MNSLRSLHCPAFPGEFGSIQDANVFCEAFVTYYNREHRSPGVLRLSHDVALVRHLPSLAIHLHGCRARRW